MIFFTSPVDERHLTTANFKVVFASSTKGVPYYNAEALTYFLFFYLNQLEFNPMMA